LIIREQDSHLEVLKER